MNDPRQYLVHLTSRGESVQSNSDGEVGQFINFTRQPMKDINKFGLLHYSIPKTLDMLTGSNSRFDIRVTFGRDVNTNEIFEVVVPVFLPELDYYNCRIAQRRDISGDSLAAAPNRERPGIWREKTTVSFDEILQTTINWAFQRRYAALRAAAPGNLPGNMHPSHRALARISCVVRFLRSRGCYQLFFGYRGSAAVLNAGAYNQDYAPGAVSESGAPCQTIPEDGVNNPMIPGGPFALGTGLYSFRDFNGVIHDNDNIPGGAGAVSLNQYQALHLTAITFERMSPRVQLMLGAPGAVMGGSIQLPLNVAPNDAPFGGTIRRGWVRLCNYTPAPLLQVGGANRRLGLLQLDFPIQPNLSSPSFMFLQLTAQGTRTKILGRQDERGGWAVPTAPNEFISKFDNFPEGTGWRDDPFTGTIPVRSMPIVNNLGTFNTFYATRHAIGQNNDGLGYDYDPIVLGAAVPNGNNMRDVSHNFADNGLIRSRHIMFADIAPSMKFPLRGRNGVGGRGYGIGRGRLSQVFTVSLIEPNWIFCKVENSTVQSLDVQLLWGDTSEEVQGSIGNPTQFSIICSP